VNAANRHETLILYVIKHGTIIGEASRTIGVELSPRQALSCLLSFYLMAINETDSKWTNQSSNLLCLISLASVAIFLLFFISILWCFFSNWFFRFGIFFFKIIIRKYMSENENENENSVLPSSLWTITTKIPKIPTYSWSWNQGQSFHVIFNFDFNFFLSFFLSFFFLNSLISFSLFIFSSNFFLFPCFFIFSNLFNFFWIIGVNNPN